MNRIFFPLILIILIEPLMAQTPGSSQAPTGRVSGIVHESSKNEPLAYATVVLTNLSDSSKTLGTLVDEKGKFEIGGVPYGAYRLVISFLGYQDHMQSKILVVPPDKTDLQLGIIKMKEDSKVLADVEVTGEKSMMQLQTDKKVFNVDKSALGAGGSATDILKQIPTVDVDYQGTISVRGSSNLQVFINGRPSGITGANKQAILDAIPANTIESVELINNPSAKFDAEGDAGIINIVLKKNTKGGFNGSFNAGYGKKYKFNSGFTLNYRKNKINLSTNYGIRWNESFWNGFNTRKNIFPDNTVSYLNTTDRGTSQSVNNTFSATFDYNINDNNTLSFNTLIGYGWFNTDGIVFYGFYDSLKTMTNYFERSFDGPTKNFNADAGVYYRKTFKSKTQDLVINGTYTFLDIKDYSYYTQPVFFTDKTRQPVTPIQEYNLATTNNHIAQLQMDYTQPFEKSKSKLELGVKSQLRNFINDFYADSLNRATSEKEPNLGLNNAFNLKENVNAAYAIYSGSYKKFGYKGGVRMEQTNLYGNQAVGDLRFDRHYIDFFPSVFLSQKFPKQHELQLAYRRSINRPNAEMLNPFADYNDPYNIRTGNPALLPVYTNAVEMSYVKNFKNVFLTSTVYYRNSKNIYTRNRYVDSNGYSNVIFANLDRGQNIGAEFVMRTQLFPWWNIMTNVNIFGNLVSGRVSAEDAGQNINSFQWNFRITTNITVWKNANLQVMAFFRSKMPFIQGEIWPFTFVNVGFKKDFLKNNKATLAVNVTDLFRTQRFRLHSVGEGFEGDLLRRWESTQFNITFTYRFGLQDNKLGPVQKKKSNFEDSGPQIEVGG